MVKDRVRRTQLQARQATQIRMAIVRDLPQGYVGGVLDDGRRQAERMDRDISN